MNRALSLYLDGLRFVAAVLVFLSHVKLERFHGEWLGGLGGRAGGPQVWLTFIYDFIVYGLLRAPYSRPMYAAEPFGAWYYNQIAGFIAKRAAALFK